MEYTNTQTKNKQSSTVKDPVPESLGIGQDTIAEVLKDQDPIVAEVLGDRAAFMSILSDQVDDCGEILRTPIPFGDYKTKKSDISFVNQKLAERVESILGYDPNSLEGLEKSLRKLMRANTKGIGIKVTADELSDAVSDRVTYASNELNLIASEQAPTNSPEFIEGYETLPIYRNQAGQILNSVELLKRLHQRLEKVATRLPSKHTIETIKQVLEVLIENDRVTAGPALRDKKVIVGKRTLKFAYSWNESAVAKSVKLYEKLQSAGELAASVGTMKFADLHLAAESQRYGLAMLQLELAKEAKETIRESHYTETEEGRELLRHVETFIADKVNQIDSEISANIKPEHKAEYRKTIERLCNSEIDMLQAERDLSIDQRDPEKLSALVTEARDILKGGRRIKTKDVKHTQEVADKLKHAFEADNDYELELSTGERGLIIAIISGKFDDFTETLAHVKREQPDRALTIVEDNRPEVIRLLREFNLDSSMMNLSVVMDSVSGIEHLSDVLSNVELKRLRDTLANYFQYEVSDGKQNTANSDPRLASDTNLEAIELFTDLDWTVLPHGENELESAARDIIELAKSRRAKGFVVDIDLSRLNILKNLKDMWGPDRCYYARGTLSGRGKVHVNGVDRPDEYIVLVLQELDSKGNLISEHAVAESPITGHNAIYVMRGDVTGFSWREVYSLPKSYARDLGARSLKHVSPEGQDLNDSLTEKIAFLLTSTKEEFPAIKIPTPKAKIQNGVGKVALAST